MLADAGATATPVLDRPEASPNSAAAVTSPAERRRGARSTAGYVLLATTTTALAILLRSGYSFGLYDQWVHSLRGVALADPDAFANDWFARSVPQPHWLFDAVTFLGTRLGALPVVYLAYWVAGIAVFALASVWLVDHFLPERRALSLALGPLVAVGPTALLGSTTPLVWFAIPHMLGGCLAFLSLAAVLTGRWRSAMVAALAAGAFHVQHGANLAPVLLAAAVLCTHASRRHRILLGGTAVGLLVGAQLVAQWRGVQTAGDEWLTACREIIPYHCYAPAWSVTYLASGAVVLALAAGFAWWARRSWRTVLPAALLPTAGLFLGVVAERFQLGVAGRLAAEYNIHRLATVVEPLAALAILCLVARIPPIPQHRLRAMLAALGALIVWVVISDGALSGPVQPGAAAAFLLTSVLLAFCVILPSGAALRDPTSGRFRRPVVAALAVATTVTIAAASAGGLGHLGYDKNVGTVQVGLALRRILPRNALILAPPELSWLRAITQRGVIVDCKATPFGKAEWQEYWVRIRTLGGPCHHQESQFEKLQLTDLEALRTAYSPTHVLLFADDPKMDYARSHWTLLYEAPPPPDASFRQGLALFALDQGQGSTHS